MFVCGYCGATGGSYCPTVIGEDELPGDDYFHPQCLVRKNVEASKGYASEYQQLCRTRLLGKHFRAPRDIGRSTWSIPGVGVRAFPMPALSLPSQGSSTGHKLHYL